MRRVETWTGYSLHPDDTKALGVYLGRCARQGDFIACCGPLGAGKTTLIQGLAQGLEVANAEYVRSPTFALVHAYHGRIPLYHFDFYRLSSCAELQDIGFEEYLDVGGVVIIEWADKFPAILPSMRLEVFIRIADSDRRWLQWMAYDTAYSRYFLHAD